MLPGPGKPPGGWWRALRAASRAHAQWEIETTRAIWARRKLLLAAAVLPVLLVLVLQGTAPGGGLAAKIPVLGGRKAFMPAVVGPRMFYGAIGVGLIAGLITGAIGAGGGHILTPAMMSFGVRGIMAVGTVQFHLFAKALMGTAIHRKLGNVNWRLAAWFVAGSLAGVTVGGKVNRAVFQHSPALSDAVISTVYVVVLGTLGVVAVADWLRQRRRGATGSAVEATTGVARRFQALRLPPYIRFDEAVVEGGRRIPVYPVILCGSVVGFVASIMGVGGGFLTFPMFVYGLGVSTFTTVGTDILQIIFTTSYSSISQYAVHGFVFYSISIGMLLGSLVGVQVGAMVTKAVKGSQIRVFYALTILAGFANRAFALPRKLADVGYVSLPRGLTVALETTGTVLFFGIIGLFALWIIAVFFRHAGALRAAGRAGQAGSPRGLIVRRGRFALGLAGLVSFAVVLAVGLSPVAGGHTVLQGADDLFNQLAKDAAYHVADARAKSAAFDRRPVDLGIRPRDAVDAAALARLLKANGFRAKRLADGRTRVFGDLGPLAHAALADADLAYGNQDAALEAKYQASAPQVVYHWWVVFSGLTRRFVQENDGAAANFTKFVTAKALEPAYNFRGIEPRPIRDNVARMVGLLAFYVIYTLWYGFSILWLFEGMGITASAAAEKKET